MYYQKHEKSLNGFKFILKENTKFNYSILIDIIYINGSPLLHVIDETTRI